jgi:ABC-type uncharacterized transport system ATPase subunit
VAALMRRSRVLVLDEAMSQLGPSDVARLFTKPRGIADSGWSLPAAETGGRAHRT